MEDLILTRLVTEFEDRRLAAVVAGDTDWLARNSSRDFLYVHSTGLLESGAEFNRHLDERGRRYTSLVPSDRTIRQFGATAVVVGSMEVKATVQGKEVLVATRYTAIYDLSDGDRPLIVGWHSSPRT